MRNQPPLPLASTTTMTSKLWNLTRVTVRRQVEGQARVLEQELANLSRITHPNILLLMGFCPPDEGQQMQLVFEHVGIGSMHHWLHKQVKITVIWLNKKVNATGHW